MLSLSTDLDLGNGCAYQLVRLEREALLANCHVQPNSRVSYHRRMRADFEDSQQSLPHVHSS